MRAPQQIDRGARGTATERAPCNWKIPGEISIRSHRVVSWVAALSCVLPSRPARTHKTQFPQTHVILARFPRFSGSLALGIPCPECESVARLARGSRFNGVASSYRQTRRAGSKSVLDSPGRTGGRAPRPSFSGCCLSRKILRKQLRSRWFPGGSNDRATSRPIVGSTSARLWARSPENPGRSCSKAAARRMRQLRSRKGCGRHRPGSEAPAVRNLISCSFRSIPFAPITLAATVTNATPHPALTP